MPVPAAAYGESESFAWVAFQERNGTERVGPQIPMGYRLAFSGYNDALSNERPTAPGYAALRERIGADTPVLYLTFGSINYLLRNPSTCRYPSPQWVQRGAHFKVVRDFPSYKDNLRCLTEDDRARYLVLQPSWFPWKKAGPDVRTVISGRFDCSVEARIPAPKGLVVCPARS